MRARLPVPLMDCASSDHVPLTDASEPWIEGFNRVDLRMVTFRCEFVTVEKLDFAIVPSCADGFLSVTQHDFHVREVVPLLLH